MKPGMGLCLSCGGQGVPGDCLQCCDGIVVLLNRMKRRTLAALERRRARGPMPVSVVVSVVVRRTHSRSASTALTAPFLRGQGS
jgi:hypothetical protein